MNSTQLQPGGDYVPNVVPTETAAFLDRKQFRSAVWDRGTDYL